MIGAAKVAGGPGRRVPRQPLRVRRDALVHDRARVGDRAAPAQVEARPRAAVPRAHEPAHRRATTSRSSRCSAGSARSRRSSSSSTLFPAVRWAGPRLARARHGHLRRLPQAPGPAADEDRVRGRQGCAGPAIEIEYRTIVLHVTDARVADEMTATALRLASERRARVVAVYTLEVPAARPLSQIAPEDEARANEQLGRGRGARAVYGVQVISRLVRTRHAGRALVEEADAPRQRGHRARLARPLAALGAALRHDRRLRAAPRALQGHGRRHARVARRRARRSPDPTRPPMSHRNRVSLLLSADPRRARRRRRSCAPRTAGGSGVAVGYIFGGGAPARRRRPRLAALAEERDYVQARAD